MGALENATGIVYPLIGPPFRNDSSSLAPSPPIQHPLRNLLPWLEPALSDELRPHSSSLSESCMWANTEHLYWTTQVTPVNLGRDRI
ncbi:hypothetical protein RSAG8_09399, partial [Rhizoctonia solani AG-8 WAC10335]